LKSESQAEARLRRLSRMNRVAETVRIESADAQGAAINYLQALGITERSYPARIRHNGKTIVTTWAQVLRETADAIVEEGLIHAYAGGRVSHVRSPQDAVSNVTAPPQTEAVSVQVPDDPEVTKCDICRSSLVGRRAGIRTCSARCRKAASRQKVAS
jgi:hypothetical protein